MPYPTYTILYVADVAASAAFHGGILGLEPVQDSPTFALFVLPDGHKLGLWRRDGVVPETAAAAGASEMAYVLEDVAAVDRLYAAWSAAGLPLPQAPTDMDFGRTFTALDPDGHRLRVMAMRAL
jgi:catechol 2,3-dioxygenase-like lactoylglutathione lyase family enzyme